MSGAEAAAKEGAWPLGAARLFWLSIGMLSYSPEAPLPTVAPLFFGFLYAMVELLAICLALLGELVRASLMQI